jgi:hypothetical protein
MNKELLNLELMKQMFGATAPPPDTQITEPTESEAERPSWIGRPLWICEEGTA